MTAFDRAPFIAIWKTTRACALACVHCRAEAGERPRVAPMPDDRWIGRALRTPERLYGRCGACEFRDGCGGSQARAWAATGDPLAEDSGCAWEPGGVATRPVPVIAGGSGAATAVTPEQVTQALREVLDPELGMSIVELGMVYGIGVRGGAVTVTMTLTAPGCPIHDVMPHWVKEAVARIPGVERVDVAITFDPPWTPDRIAR
jgi:metal-sulfur cluster biosynthetic enzyme